LGERLAALGAEAIVTVLGELANGVAREAPQAPEGVTYAAKIAKSEAAIDWREDAAAIERKVRAFDPWPVAETRFEGAQLRLWSATAEADSETLREAARAPCAAPDTPRRPGEILAASAAGIDVACGRGVLRIERLQLPGRKPLAAGEFARARALVGKKLGLP
jgi:methionyl-tRNA formyltransferase